MSKSNCPVCGRRRQLGRCAFGGGKANVSDHCRACCAAPARDGWKANPATKVRKVAAGA